MLCSCLALAFNRSEVAEASLRHYITFLLFWGGLMSRISMAATMVRVGKKRLIPMSYEGVYEIFPLMLLKHFNAAFISKKNLLSSAGDVL